VRARLARWRLIAKEINASDVDRFLEAVIPATPVEQVRYDLAVELLDDIRRLDSQLKASHKRIRVTVQASATSDLFGVGPIIAGMLIGYSSDVDRFRNRDQFAAYNGTAPVEFSSGGRVTHRLSERGNRQLNHAIHMAAICQLRQPHSDGRAYFERKVAQGKTNKEAIPLTETPHQQRGLPPTRRRRPSHHQVGGAREDKRERH
jgi:transposase